MAALRCEVELDEQAREEFWPRYLQVITHVAETRGFAIPTKESFMYEVVPRAALFVGSPETVAHKIAATLPECPPPHARWSLPGCYGVGETVAAAFLGCLLGGRIAAMRIS
jgi:hypothetical protein